MKLEIKKGALQTDVSEIKGIIREYFENLHFNKLENLEEMNAVLGT
jgi:hypothetical protein